MGPSRGRTVRIMATDKIAGRMRAMAAGKLPEQLARPSECVFANTALFAKRLAVRPQDMMLRTVTIGGVARGMVSRARR